MALEVAQLVASLKGDVSGFTTSMKQAQGDAAEFESQSKSHFAGVTGAVKGIVGAVGAIGFAEMAKSAIESADTQETAFASLKQTMLNYGLGNKQAEASVDEFIKKQAAANGFLENDVTGAYSSVFNATHDVAASNKDLALAEDIARAKHIDLATAADMVAKATAGNTMTLARQFPAIKEMIANHASAADILNVVTQSVKGQAAAFDNTSGGAMARFHSSINELEISVGEKLIPALVKLVNVGQDIIRFFSNHPLVTKFVEVVAALGAAVVIVNKAQEAWKATTEAFTAVQAAFNAVMDANPIVLVIGAIALLAAGIYEAYEHFGPFHDAVDAAWQILQGAFNWVKSNWPLILEILTGPIGIAVGLIIGHWGTIKDGFTAVKNWISDRVGDIVGFITGIPGRIAGIATHAFDAVKDAVTDAKNWVSDRVGDIIAFIRGIPGRLGDVAGDILKKIAGPAGGVVSGVVNKIGGLFAEGGRPPLGVPSIIGEKGPELFWPDAAGTVLPNSVFGGGGSAPSVVGSPGGYSGGGGNTYAITVNVAAGADPSEVGRQTVEAIRAFERRSGASWRAA